MMRRSRRRNRWSDYSNGRVLMLAILGVLLLGIALTGLNWAIQAVGGSASTLLTDPFLQLPTANSVRVVWFTEFEGDRHTVRYGDLGQTAAANTTKLSRVREDEKSRVGAQTEDGQVYQAPVMRDVWRHEAEVTGLEPGVRVPYQVMSEVNGQQVRSDRFTLAALPNPGQPLKILLTSDHQQMPMTAANLQKVVETVGQPDAVFLAGDLVNIPDRASEWFDDNRGAAFFPSLQGHAERELDRDGVVSRYSGGAIIQSAPLFPAIGNHEVMGRFSMDVGLGEQFDDPYPRQAAAEYAEMSQLDANTNSTQTDWLQDHSFNSDTYEEVFTLPESSSGGEKYYAVSLGDVRLVVLYAANIWRKSSLGPEVKGKYRERDDDLKNPEKWGYGQHIFESIQPGSLQYDWLQAELNGADFQRATYKVVMFHHPPHSLGDNVMPAYTDPVQVVDRLPDGRLNAVRYEYPLEADYLIRDVVPLLEEAGVQLVYYGHSHIWNRFVSDAGMHFLESSNVGNTYGAYVENKRRSIPLGFDETYVAMGDPNGLEPVMPSIAPLLDEAGQPQPYVSSDQMTAFSILDTGTGTVSSYRFDTRDPGSEVIQFDQFQLQ
uniref:fibronectin type III domain-containing protein n=2 Tax=Oculatella sp. LEGE 06141 TaxID=1828648 RepID=UPI001D153F22|nr:fibronectin type III domain-containing protein [Oculatella sp. LEGE 06141]